MILLTQGGTKTAPPWLTSLAVKFKEGKVKKVSFGHARTDDEPGIAARFGVTSFPAVLVVVPGEDAHVARFERPVPSKPAAALRELKEFVESVVAGDAPASSRAAVPAFPPPDVPRKQADVAYAPLSEDNLHSACFGGKRSLCALALVAPAPGGAFAEDGALAELARKYRNDPVSFVWLDASAQPEFAAALGVEAAQAPALVVVKHGKRPRVARMEGPLTAAGAAAFLDRVLGGDVQFAPLKELPELVSDAVRDALRNAEAEL